EGDRTIAGQRCSQSNTSGRQRGIEPADRIDVAGSDHVADREGGRRTSGRREDERLTLERVCTRIGQIGRSTGDTQRAGAGRCCGRGGSPHRITNGRLQDLVGDRLRGIYQLLQRGEAGVGSLQDLHAVADTIEQIVDVAGAVVETLRGEEVGRVVESRIDLLAGRKAVLRGGEQFGGRLQREQVLANRCRKNNAGHVSNLPSFTSVVLR